MSDEAIQLVSGAPASLESLEVLPPPRQPPIFARLFERIKRQLMSVGRQAVPVDGVPWRAIPKVTVSSGNVTSNGTGFFIKPNWVITAAHVIWEGRYQVGAVPTITVETPTGASAFADFVMHPSYDPRTNGQAFDIALLKVRSALPTGGTYFPLYQYGDDWLRTCIQLKDVVSLAGYPQDLGYPLVEAHNPLTGFDADYIYHDIECAKGESGGPLIFLTPTTFAPLGVHVYVGDPGRSNTATRLNSSMLSWLLGTIAANP